MRLLLKKAIICLFCGFVVLACVHLENKVEPKLVEVIPEKIETSIPKDSLIIPLKLDTTLLKDTVVIKLDTVVKKPDLIKPNVVVQDTTKKELGDKIFEFYAITPPEVSFSLPSHSIVMMPVTYVGIDKGVANSFCEYWLYTKDGKLVCYCKNTVSGLHPVYANSVNANNHLPEFTKKIGYGEYRLVYKNISKVPVRQDLIFGQIIKENKDQIDTKIDSGETKEFCISIFPTTSSFKLNNNNKIPI